jgi:hypothetical protein
MVQIYVKYFKPPNKYKRIFNNILIYFLIV